MILKAVLPNLYVESASIGNDDLANARQLSILFSQEEWAFLFCAVFSPPLSDI
jgi:hypothetical protein